MSYDIDLCIDTGAPEPHRLDICWNFTSNVSRMWRTAGADLAEFDGKPTAECTPILEAAIAEMRANPDKYRAMDSPNGWGTYDHLMPRLDYLLACMKTHPKTTVYVSR